MNNSTQSQVFALFAALILAAVLASGCSTPPQNDSQYSNQAPAYTNYVTPNPYYPNSAGTTSTASTSQPVTQSYIQCVNVMTAYGLQQQCNQVSNPYAASYSQYTLTIKGFTKGVSASNLQQAYGSYLNSLDANTAANLKAQYDAIVEQYAN